MLTNKEVTKAIKRSQKKSSPYLTVHTLLSYTLSVLIRDTRSSKRKLPTYPEALCIPLDKTELPTVAMIM